MKFLSDLLPVIVIRQVPYVCASEESLSATPSHRSLLCHIQYKGERVSLSPFVLRSDTAGQKGHLNLRMFSFSYLATGLSEERSVKSCVEDLAGSVDLLR